MRDKTTEVTAQINDQVIQTTSKLLDEIRKLSSSPEGETKKTRRKLPEDPFINIAPGTADPVLGPLVIEDPTSHLPTAPPAWNSPES